MPVPSSPNFTAAEVLRASAPAPTAEVEANGRAIADTLAKMERVRSLLGGRAITMTSLYRTAAENAAEGGSNTSDHLTGRAVDFTVKGLSPSQVMATLAPHARALGVDQLIVYRTHIHAGFGPKMRAQLLDKRSGTFRQWTGDTIIPEAAPADATRTNPNPSSTPMTSPTGSNRGKWFVGLLGALLAAAVAYLQQKGAP